VKEFAAQVMAVKTVTSTAAAVTSTAAAVTSTAAHRMVVVTSTAAHQMVVVTSTAAHQTVVVTSTVVAVTSGLRSQSVPLMQIATMSAQKGPSIASALLRSAMASVFPHAM
jgi:hypothetical protein